VNKSKFIIIIYLIIVAEKILKITWLKIPHRVWSPDHPNSGVVKFIKGLVKWQKRIKIYVRMEGEMNLKNTTVVITGGSDGLGLALAKAFIAKGAEVHIIGLDKTRLDNALKELGNQASGYTADVTNLEAMQTVAQAIGPVDILINNAGIWLEGLVTDNSGTEISRLIDVNLKGVIFSTKVFLPALLKKDEAYLVNISSTTGLRGRDNQAVYAASKFGVTGFTESLKVDLANTNVVVCGFYPGGMHTSLFDKACKPKDNQDWMDTHKVAEIIIFMIERDASMMMDQVVVNKRKTKTSN
jgi:uncharacterized protein